MTACCVVSYYATCCPRLCHHPHIVLISYLYSSGKLSFQFQWPMANYISLTPFRHTVPSADSSQSSQSQSQSTSMLYKSRVRTEPTSVTAPQWTAALWNRLENLIEEMAGCCIKVRLRVVCSFIPLPSSRRGCITLGVSMGQLSAGTG